MLRIRKTLSIMAILLALLLLLTLLSGIVCYIAGIQTSGCLSMLAYFVKSYVLPLLVVILMFIVKPERKVDRH